MHAWGNEKKKSDWGGGTEGNEYDKYLRETRIKGCKRASFDILPNCERSLREKVKQESSFFLLYKKKKLKPENKISPILFVWR